AAEALILVLAENRVRVAVDGFGITRTTFGHLEAAIERNAVSFADELVILKHPDGDCVAKNISFLSEVQPQVRVVFQLKSHSAMNGVGEAEGEGHGRGL